MHIDQISAGTLVSYYDDADFRGESYMRNLNPGRCVNSAAFNKRIGSINTHGNCVTLYEDWDCKGDNRKLQSGSEGHSDLKIIGFNDKTSSMRLC